MTVISVVIVTYNGWPLLRACLTSLKRQVRRPGEIIVVDNGSHDGTRDHLSTQFPDVTLVEAGRNLGFAAGNNLGIARARGDIVVLLNNDTVAEPEFLARLVDPFDRDPRLGSVASTMVFSTAPDIIASAGIDVFDNGLALDRGLGLPRGACMADVPVFGASAGAAAYRRAALDDVGRFPESFFMYLEDVDLAWRLRLRGWDTVHAPGAVVRHDYSASAVEGSARKRFLLARNRLWVIARCVPGSLLRRHWRRILRYDAQVFGYGVTRLDHAATRGRIAGLLGLPSRMAEREGIQSSMTVSNHELDLWLRPSLPGAELLRLRHLSAGLAGGGTGK
jgi:GT2 family glycosyltransferase